MRQTDLRYLDKKFFTLEDVFNRFPLQGKVILKTHLARMVRNKNFTKLCKNLYTSTWDEIELYSIPAIFRPETYISAEQVLIKHGITRARDLINLYKYDGFHQRNPFNSFFEGLGEIGEVDQSDFAKFTILKS